MNGAQRTVVTGADAGKSGTAADAGSDARSDKDAPVGVVADAKREERIAISSGT